MGEGLKRANAAAKATRAPTAKQARDQYVKERAPFVRELARFLVADQVKQSIGLQMGREDAKAWAQLRGTVSPLFGYPTVAEAEDTIAKWLGLYPLPSDPHAR